MSSANHTRESEHGAVVVTLALSVTMLMVVIALVAQTLFHLLAHTLFLRAVADMTEVLTGEPSLGCEWLTNTVTVGWATAEVVCEAAPDYLLATVSRASDGLMGTRQVARVVIHRGQ